MVSWVCVMKRSKRSPPAANQSLLGVQLDVSSSYATVAPTERRRANLAQLAQKHLDSSKVSPTDAGSFAGKAGFFATTCVWSCGRAATKPLFARQHATLHHAARLSHGSQGVTSYFSTLSRRRNPTLVYADAYFLLGDQRYRGSDISNNSIAVHVNHIQHLKNGFGPILFPVSDQPVFFHGEVPSRVL